MRFQAEAPQGLVQGLGQGFQAPRRIGRFVGGGAIFFHHLGHLFHIGGNIAAALPERLNGSGPFKALKAADKDFTAPNRPIRSITRPVKGNADDGLFTVVFGHAGQDLDIVMLDGHDRPAQFAGDRFGFEIGIQLAQEAQLMSSMSRSKPASGTSYPALRTASETRSSCILSTTVTLGALAQPLASASTVRCTMARRSLTAVGLVTGLALLL